MDSAMRGDVTNSFLNVEKHSEITEGGKGIVTFTVASTTEIPLAMRIVDPLPDGVTLDEVGFHREYKLDHWSEVGDSHVAFSDTLLPRDSIDVFYYFDPGSDEDVSVPEPTIEETEPINPDLAKEPGPPMWRSQPAGIDTAHVVDDGPLPSGFQTETITGPMSPSPDGGSSRNGNQDESDAASGTFAELKAEHEQVEYDEIREDVDEVYPDEVGFKELLIGDEDSRLPDRAEMPAGGNSPDESDEQPDQSDVTEAPGESSVLGILIQELDEYDLSEDDRQRLREQLGLTPPHHTTVKVRHLQAKVADLTAYIDALESFLDDNGTAGELLGSLEESVHSLESDLASIESSVDGLEDRQEAISTHLDAMEEDLQEVSQVQTDVARHREQIDEATDRLGGMQDTIEYFDQRFDEVETLAATVERHETEIGELQRLAESTEEKFRTIGATFESASRAFSVSEGE